MPVNKSKSKKKKKKALDPNQFYDDIYDDIDKNEKLDNINTSQNIDIDTNITIIEEPTIEPLNAQKAKKEKKKKNKGSSLQVS
jgi:hypothetical protein